MEVFVCIPLKPSLYLLPQIVVIFDILIVSNFLAPQIV